MFQWPSSQRTVGRRALLGAALLSLTLGANAQTGNWPDRAIRLVVAGPPGSGMDIYGRMLAVPLHAALGTPVVVDNKAGANSIIGNDTVAKAAPDGYTFLFTPSSAIAINPVVQRKMPYDNKDLQPVAQVGAGGILLVTNPASGLESLEDMVRHAKANPGKLAYATWGNGSTGHLVMEGIKAHYGLDMPHVAYKGTAPIVNDLLGDNIRVAFTDIASPVPHIRSGRLVALGATGSGRGPALPEVPTLSEQGYRFDADGWYGVFAPAGTPMPIVRRMNEEINKILATPEMQQKFATQNMLEPPLKSVDEFEATVSNDIQLWQDLARKIDLQID